MTSTTTATTFPRRASDIVMAFVLGWLGAMMFFSEKTIMNTITTISVAITDDVDVNVTTRRGWNISSDRDHTHNRPDDLHSLNNNKDNDNTQTEMAHENIDKEGKTPPETHGTPETATSTTTSATTTKTTTSTSAFSVCRALHHQNRPSAAALWTQNLDTILHASRHPLDANFSLRNHTQSLLRDLPPARLRSALKSRPHPSDLGRLLQIVERRKANPDQYPPLIVLVMGGSIAEGRGCQDVADQDEGGTVISNGRDCAWSTRLQALINNLLGFDGIKIVNMASGGTNSGQGTGLVKYWMYPPEILPHGPDIIINAYGANDSNYAGGPDDVDELDLHRGVVEQTQRSLNNFINTVHGSHGCPPPLVFHLDEYVGGHAKGGIFQDLAYTSTMTQLARWYGNFAVSSADVVRNIIYADTTESVFSPVWKMKKGKFREECHFGASGHQLITWSFAYSMLEVITSYCEDEEYASGDLHETLDATRERKIAPVALELLNNNVPPPPLDLELRLEDVSTRWASRMEERKEYCSGPVGGVPCLFAWVAGPEGKTRDQGSLDRYLKPYIASQDGWKSEADMSHGWSRKLGFVPTKAGASVDFMMKDITDEIHVVNINYIKSYGEKWAGSLARVTVSVKEKGSEEFTEVKQYDLEGIHDSNTSVSYSSAENMGEQFAKVGSTLKVNLTMIGGSAFKITGMMFCRF